MIMNWASRGIRRRQERRGMRNNISFKNASLGAGAAGAASSEHNASSDNSSTPTPRRSIINKAGRLAGNTASSRSHPNHLSGNARGTKNTPAVSFHSQQKKDKDFKTDTMNTVGDVNNPQEKRRVSNSQKMAERRKLMNQSKAQRRGNLSSESFQPRISRSKTKNIKGYTGSIDQNKHKYVLESGKSFKRSNSNKQKNKKRINDRSRLKKANTSNLDDYSKVLDINKRHNKDAKLAECSSPKQHHKKRAHSGLYNRSNSFDKEVKRIAKLNGREISLKQSPSKRKRGRKRW